MIILKKIYQIIQLILNKFKKTFNKKKIVQFLVKTIPFVRNEIKKEKDAIKTEFNEMFAKEK